MTMPKIVANMPSLSSHSTPMNEASSSVDCSSPMPRSVVRSVRCCASAASRWSGLLPIGPALASRKARSGASHSVKRSPTSPCRSTSRVIWFSHVCATFSTSRPQASVAKTPSWVTKAGRFRVVRAL